LLPGELVAAMFIGTHVRLLITVISFVVLIVIPLSLSFVEHWSAFLIKMNVDYYLSVTGRPAPRAAILPVQLLR
jgi:hypothetical protein